MNRKIASVVATFALAVLMTPVQAQPAEKIHRIGYVHWRAAPNALDKTFVRALRDFGWIEGKNLAIEYRWGMRRRGNRAATIAELLQRNLDVLVTAGRVETGIAMKASSAIPIVMHVVPDAVENKLVQSLARPGGNVTGVSPQFARIFSKLLELLHETLPKAKRVVFFSPMLGPPARRYARAVEAAARTHGITVDRHPSTDQGRPRTAQDLRRILDGPAISEADAMIAFGSAMVNFGQVISDVAARRRLPVFTPSWLKVKDNFALLGFGPDHFETHRQTASYVDKILRGAKPSDLPVQQARKFKLVVNLKVARALGIKVPPSILLRATDVVE